MQFTSSATCNKSKELTLFNNLNVLKVQKEKIEVLLKKGSNSNVVLNVSDEDAQNHFFISKDIKFV